VCAHGGEVSLARFLAPSPGGWPTAVDARSKGDVVPTSYGVDFVGLDFGVREWVFDVPHIRGAEALLVERLSDHVRHLDLVVALALGRPEPPFDPVGPMRSLGVVRGLAFGEREGLIDAAGARLSPSQHRTLPDPVPGVLRTLQLRRDGVGLLNTAHDPRLAQIGFRVAGSAGPLARRWGYR
jgi:hypothetical protein